MAKIRLTESDLRNIIKESVKKIVNEINRKPVKWDFNDDSDGRNWPDDDCLYFFDKSCDLKKAAKYAKMAGAYDENGKLDTDKGALIYFKRMVDLNDEYAWDIDYVLRKMENVGTLPLNNGETATIVFDNDCYMACKDIPRSYYDYDDEDYPTENNTSDITTFGYPDSFYDYHGNK